MQNKIVTLGPQAIANAAADLWSPPTLTGGTNVPENCTKSFYIIRKIRVTNKTSSSATFTLYKGLTGGSAAGTEIVGGATTVAANSVHDWQGLLRLDSLDTNKFISGVASAATTLTIEAEAEMGIS